MITSLIHTQVGEDNVAAVIIEPIQGEGGFIVPPPGFLPGLAEFCARHGILLIADEIQSGFCRTGDWFGCDHEGVVPDLVTTAKGIAGGLPLAAVTGRAEIMDSVHVGGLGGTYGGNPVACAAALGAIETMEAEDLAGRARRIGEIMLPRLRKLAGTYPVIADVRGRGAMIAIELAEPGTLDPDRGHHRAGGQGLPRGRARRAHLRDVRQRAAVPAAAGHRREPARGGPVDPGGRLRQPVTRPGNRTTARAGSSVMVISRWSVPRPRAVTSGTPARCRGLAGVRAGADLVGVGPGGSTSLMLPDESLTLTRCGTLVNAR